MKVHALLLVNELWFCVYHTVASCVKEFGVCIAMASLGVYYVFLLMQLLHVVNILWGVANLVVCATGDCSVCVHVSIVVCAKLCSSVDDQRKQSMHAHVSLAVIQRGPSGPSAVSHWNWNCSHWYKYSTCAHAACTVWWWLYVVV